MADDPYSRIYWSVMDDPKFDGIREDVAHFGSWSIMLVVAEMAYPASAFLPAFVPSASVDALSEVGLVERLTGQRFRICGLAKEREKRSEKGRNAAAVRWQSARNADPLLAKQSKDEQSSTPLPLTEGRRTNGTNPRATGTNPRAQGTSPRQEIKRQKSDPTSIHDILERSRRT
jgi:hypothetical protein